MRTYKNRGEGGTTSTVQTGHIPNRMGPGAFLRLFFSGQNAKKGVYHGTRAAEVKEKLQFVFENESGNKTDV